MENSILNQTEEIDGKSEIEQIQSELAEPKIEKPIDESSKLLFKPGTKSFDHNVTLFMSLTIIYGVSDTY